MVGGGVGGMSGKLRSFGGLGFWLLSGFIYFFPFRLFCLVSLLLLVFVYDCGDVIEILNQGLAHASVIERRGRMVQRHQHDGFPIKVDTMCLAVNS